MIETTEELSPLDVVGSPMQLIRGKRVIACVITNYDPTSDTYEVTVFPSHKLDGSAAPYPMPSVKMGEEDGQIQPVGGFDEEDEEEEAVTAPVAPGPTVPKLVTPSAPKGN